MEHSSHPLSPQSIKRFPFDPGRLPFFYGWGVLLVGTVGVVASAPGQTIGVSVFTEHLIESLQLSRTNLSLAYFAGTIGAGLLLTWAGRLYDLFGGRLVGSVAALSLAGVLFALTKMPQVAGFLGGGIAAFGVMALGFFLLRFTGQAMLTLSSRNMVMEWFDERRGLANAVMGISISFGYSYAPRVFDDLIGSAGWRGAWRTMGLLIAGFAVVAFLLYRDTPEAHGLVPDGPLHGRGRKKHAETTTAKPFTLPQARRTYAFWLFALALFLQGLVMTAYTFHVVSIFDDAGFSREVAVGIFLPAAVVAFLFGVVGSYVSDYIRLKYLVMVQLAGLAGLSVCLAFLSPGLTYLGVIAGHGLMQGMFGVVSNVTWPRFFGREHLGAIAGFAMALIMAGTAIGPYVFSFGRDLSGSYAAPTLICAALAVLLLFGASRADRPEHPG